MPLLQLPLGITSVSCRNCSSFSGIAIGTGVAGAVLIILSIVFLILGIRRFIFLKQVAASMAADAMQQPNATTVGQPQYNAQQVQPYNNGMQGYPMQTEFQPSVSTVPMGQPGNYYYQPPMSTQTIPSQYNKV